MEGRQDVFDAVRNATMAGKHVIAAAGNGTQNLDNAAFNNAFNRTVRDSGSIIVGATNAGTLARASFSNYGSIVDANGWGFNVTTTGYTDLFFGNSDPRQKYTAVFSGTSSATPIVTSASAATISAAKQQLGRVISVSELRALLRAHGTDVPGGLIGRRPDLVRLFAAIGLPDGLTLQNEANVGQTLTLNIGGNAGELYFLLLAAAPAELPISIGRLLLDPVTMVVAGSGAVNTTFSAPVPNNPDLRLLEVHWQAVRFNAALTTFRMTNSVVSYFER
jgi:subtilisin family serine protease